VDLAPEVLVHSRPTTIVDHSPLDPLGQVLVPPVIILAFNMRMGTPRHLVDHLGTEEFQLDEEDLTSHREMFLSGGDKEKIRGIGYFLNTK